MFSSSGPLTDMKLIPVSFAMACNGDTLIAPTKCADTKSCGIMWSTPQVMWSITGSCDPLLGHVTNSFIFRLSHCFYSMQHTLKEHVSDTSVYLGRGRVGGSPTKWGFFKSECWTFIKQHSKNVSMKCSQEGGRGVLPSQQVKWLTSHTNLCQQGLATSWGASQQNARRRWSETKLSKLPRIAHRSLGIGREKEKSGGCP